MLGAFSGTFIVFYPGTNPPLEALPHRQHPLYLAGFEGVSEGKNQQIELLKKNYNWNNIAQQTFKTYKNNSRL